MQKDTLRIHFWGEKILRKKCRPVKNVTREIKTLLEQMYLLMKVTDGVGLAANQAGLQCALVVIETEEGILRLVNPRIVRKKGKVSFEEGCLSFPGITLSIKRAKKVWVKALNELGREIDVEADGVLAVVLQHEIDHINGVVFVDRVSLLKRFSIRKKLQDITKRIRKN